MERQIKINVATFHEQQAKNSHTHKCTHTCPTRSDWWFQEGALGQRKSSLGQTSSTHPGMSTICMHSQATHALKSTPPHLLYNVFPLSDSSSVSERGRGRGVHRVKVSRARWARRRSVHSTVLGLRVPLWASMGLFLTAAITTNNWTANEDKWYDCSARPSSQSAI